MPTYIGGLRINQNYLDKYPCGVKRNNPDCCHVCCIDCEKVNECIEYWHKNVTLDDRKIHFFYGKSICTNQKIGRERVWCFSVLKTRYKL